MFWTIMAAVVWLFIILFLRSSLVKYWGAGFWSIIVGYLLNDFFIKNGFFVFNHILYPIRGIPVAYFALLAGIGIVVVFFLPQNKIWQLPYLILLVASFSTLELFAEKQGYLTYINWNLYSSFLFKLLTLVTITWLSNLIIKHRKNDYYYNRDFFK